MFRVGLLIYKKKCLCYRPYFDACDGIFTNYSWNEGDVENSAIAAGDRINDLYIGIDVWGRNFFGGGQFNTQEVNKRVFF